ncbi:MAG: hypothetical protein WCI54_02280 [Bacteroidia bacterium]
MKLKFGFTSLLFLLVHAGFTQSGTQVSTLPAKANPTQTSSTKSGSTGDIAKGEAVTETEGKKGLNAVNVKRSKQSEVRANTKTANSTEAGSSGNIPESKHAINTKGTGATRDK